MEEVTRHARHGGRSGSSSSCSWSLQRKRRVIPHTYSFGCCKSFLIALLTINILTIGEVIPHEDHLLF